MDKIRIVLADDHQMILEGLQAMLNGEDEIEVIEEARDGVEVIELVQSNREIDVVVLDINMPRLDGIETTKRIKAAYPEIKVLILSMYNRVEFVKNLLESGTDGYILKNSGKQVLITALKSLARGEPYYSAEITQTIMKSYQRTRTFDHSVYAELSDREKEVIIGIALEKTTQEIAEMLCLSKHTIDTHRKNVLSKLDVKNAAGIVKYAIQSGLVKDFDL